MLITGHLPMWARLNIARSRAPSNEFPMNTDAKAARAMRTWIFTVPPARFRTASRAAETYNIENKMDSEVPNLQKQTLDT